MATSAYTATTHTCRAESPPLPGTLTSKKADHLAQQRRVGTLLQKRAKGDHVVGHRGGLQGQSCVRNPTLPRSTTVTTAVDKWPAYAKLSAVAQAGHLPTAPTPPPGTRLDIATYLKQREAAGWR